VYFETKPIICGFAWLKTT